MNVQKWRVQRLALASERGAAFNEMRVCPKANYTWVTCTASSPLTCCTFRSRFPSLSASERTARVTAGRSERDSRDLGCLVTPPRRPCSPLLVKQKWNRWRTSANSCQSCHALRRRPGLDTQLGPAATPPPPPSSLTGFFLADLFNLKKNKKNFDTNTFLVRNACKYN